MNADAVVKAVGAVLRTKRQWYAGEVVYVPDAGPGVFLKQGQGAIYLNQLRKQPMRRVGMLNLTAESMSWVPVMWWEMGVRQWCKEVERLA